MQTKYGPTINKTEINTTKETRRNPIPRRAFDSDYTTQYVREVNYLRDSGFKYVSESEIGDYHIRTYRYRKSSALFDAVSKFYRKIESERLFNTFNKLMTIAQEFDIVHEREDEKES